MQVFRDYIGREVRLTDETREHISEDHPELLRIDLESSIADTLVAPDVVMRSRRREIGEVFYKQRTTDPFLNRYVCVVVKVLDVYGYVWTAYVSSRIMRGEALWRKGQ